MKKILLFAIAITLYIFPFSVQAFAEPVTNSGDIAVLRFDATKFVEYRFEVGSDGSVYIRAGMLADDSNYLCKIIATVQQKINGQWKNIYTTGTQRNGAATFEDTSQIVSPSGTYCCVYDFYVYDGNTLLEHITKIESQ